jgi:four helix bundle protein
MNPMTTKSEQLQDRLAQFGADVADMINSLPRDVIGQNAAKQMAKSSSSPFSNYGEACEAESPADYIHKVKIALKELRETRGWIVYVGKLSHCALDVSALDNECNELIAILVTCVRKTREKGDGRRGRRPSTRDPRS